mmetsp:Transcript_66109/g.149209  ORF Transcript_66109/g.149209 Transcript_66109/m.149209 type:complete len:96 (+) Transcript_66109:68-355(+)
MWRPDAGPCVAQVAEWGKHPDDVEYMRMLKAMPKKILKRRETVCKDKDLEVVVQGSRCPLSDKASSPSVGCGVRMPAPAWRRWQNGASTRTTSST